MKGKQWRVLAEVRFVTGRVVQARRTSSFPLTNWGSGPAEQLRRSVRRVAMTVNTIARLCGRNAGRPGAWNRAGDRRLAWARAASGSPGDRQLWS